MLTVTAPDPIDGQRLRNELASAGYVLSPEDIIYSLGNLNFVTLDESDRSAIEAVTTVHTGEPTEEVQEAASRRAQLEALEQKARDVWNGTDTFTNNQAQQILAGLVLLEIRDRT